MRLKRFFLRNRVIISTIIVILILFVYYLYLHRHPRTDDAFVVANVIAISSFVPGYITNIYITNGQEVKKGDKLFTVYKAPYELEVKKVNAELTASQYSTKAVQSKITAKEYAVKVAEDEYNNAIYLANQAKLLSQTEAVSQKEAEILISEMDETAAQLKIAENDLETAKAQYESSIANEISLQAQLDNAKLNLDMTTVYARSNGTISNMYITPGVYATPGSALLGSSLFSFIDTTKWWIVANIKETELNRVVPGQKVWIKIWMYPDKIFQGRVTNNDWNVNRFAASTDNFLLNVQKQNEWFHLPQRFPVQIELIDLDTDKYPMHIGATATVVIDTEDHLFRHFFWQINWW